MHRIIFLLAFIPFLSCKDKMEEGKYYSHAKWQKFRKEYDFGLLRGKPLEVKENFYMNLSDTTLNAGGDANGYEKFKFNAEGEMIFWQLYKKEGRWIIGEMSYDKNGMQARYYSDKDSLKTYQDISKVSTTKLAEDKYLMHSFFNIGPSFILISNQNEGNIIKKEFIADSSDLKNVAKTVIYYYQNENIQKTETFAPEGFHQVENYYYSKGNRLDSIYKIVQDKITEKEFFINNLYGDPVKYGVIRFPKSDTVKYVNLEYLYDSHKNWIKRLENKIIGDYNTNGKNIHYTLVSREITY